MKRVVITGAAGVTALGDDWSTIYPNLKIGKNKVVTMPEWDRYEALGTRLAAPVTHFENPKHFTRKKIRSMGRVSLMATYATENALITAGLLDDPIVQSGAMGVAYGSSIGSTPPILAFGEMMKTGKMKGVTATSYIKMMPHTTAANIGVYFSTKGRVITTSSACTSGSQAIGYAYEAIQHGKQPLMIAGGGEELCATEAAVFDTLYATSTKNDTPELTPRPYDVERDGLVIGEGACTLILEELEHAKARGANILAEIVGFGTNSDGLHVTQPSSETMGIAMKLALSDANLSAKEIGYVNGHGTATDKGDIAETLATEHAIGKNTPISSLKSYVGHTLGACGSMEAWLSIEMMRNNWFAPTINLSKVDPQCGELDYISGSGMKLDTEYVMSNNFAFGGINTSLIFKRWQE